jgi:hypothetical protein
MAQSGGFPHKNNDIDKTLFFARTLSFAPVAADIRITRDSVEPGKHAFCGRK